MVPPPAVSNARVTDCVPSRAWNVLTADPTRTRIGTERPRTTASEDGRMIWDAHG